MRASPARLARSLGHPGAWLAVTAGLIYLNQVLFTVYVLRVHHGDPSFIARYLPSGWFSLARWPALETLARQVPDPALLAPSVLRVQAFLELPFVTFAYLTVCRWFGAGAYRRALRLAWPASAVWTVTFCLVEWHLRNPYTADDLVIRAAAGIAVPLVAATLLAGRLSAAAPDQPSAAAPDQTPAAPDQPQNLPGLMVLAVSTAAVGWLVLVVYSTALLYNLGRLGPDLPGAVLALAVLAGARAAARHVLPGRLAVWSGQMTLTVLAGLCGASASLLLPASYAETRLLWAAAAFFLCAITACALLDRILPAAAVTDQVPGRHILGGSSP
jgi:hypothetical protein